MGLLETSGLSEDAGLLEWAVAAAALPGEDVSGDAHVVKPFPGGVLVGVVDGLGHGPEACRAAAIAVSTLEEHPEGPVDSLVERCHGRLRRTRGVALTLASFDGDNGTMSWLGVGNVEGVAYRPRAVEGGRREHVATRGGVVGGQLPPLRTTVLRVQPGDVLVLATDGLTRAWGEAVMDRGRPDEIAQVMLARFRKGNDDALVLAARYRGPAS